MRTSTPAEARTLLLARILGPFLAAIDITALLSPPDVQAITAAAAADPLRTWVAGVFTLLVGLVVVAVHPHYRGFTAIMVSGVGWLTLLKGVLVLAFPTASVSFAAAGGDAALWWRPAYVMFAVLGLYLAYVGWRPASSELRTLPTGKAPCP